jgi:hypothetical protein
VGYAGDVASQHDLRADERIVPPRVQIWVAAKESMVNLCFGVAGVANAAGIVTRPRLAIIGNSGHFTELKQAQVVANAIVDFLAERATWG